MLRAVLDSNVLVSALATPEGATRQILFAIGERFTLIISDYIVAEVRRTLVDKIKDPPHFVDERLGALYRIAAIVEPVLAAYPGVDEQDWPILGTAIAGRTDFLVTGDKVLLSTKEFKGIAVVTPRQFLELLKI